MPGGGRPGAPARGTARVEVHVEHVGSAESGPLGASIGHRVSRSQSLTRRGAQSNLIKSHLSGSSRRGEGVRKPEATWGGRRIDPASASPKNLQLRRRVLLDRIAPELGFHARSPPDVTSMNGSGCPRCPTAGRRRVGRRSPHRRVVGRGAVILTPIPSTSDMRSRARDQHPQVGYVHHGHNGADHHRNAGGALESVGGLNASARP